MASFRGRQILTAERGGVSEPVYLHVELRDLPGLIRHLGSQQGAAAMFKFGETVRQAVTSFPGTQIKSEGDSYLCTCPSAATAIGTAQAILSGGATGRDGGPAITVACGVVLAEDSSVVSGYVEAARMAGAAPDGACLVSEAVRELAPTGHTFRRAREIERATESKDRLWLVDATLPTLPVATAPPRRPTRILAAFGVCIVVVAVVATAAYGLISRGGGGILPPGQWTIAAQLPLSGDLQPVGETLVNAIQMALDGTDRQGVADGQLKLDIQDEGDPESPYLATSSVDEFIANNSVLAMVGPLESTHGAVDIPPTNAAGLLTCSPGNTNPTLTKPRFGALDLRSQFPSRINYVRVITSDDIQGPAAAGFIFHPPTTGIAGAGIRGTKGLGVHKVVVVDDTSPAGRRVADAFQTAFTSLGGATERRALNPGSTTFTDILSPLGDSSNGPWAVYYAGNSYPASQLKQAMVFSGYASVPLVSWDGLFDGSGMDTYSYINLAGHSAANTYITQASIPPPRAEFSQRYQETFGANPNSYAAAAYACTQIVLAAIEHVAQAGVDAAELRDAVRAYAVDPANRFDTSIGTVSFDANGDAISQYVTLYEVDMGANYGAGDWVYLDQQDFGPAP